jgi:hypothetical protein
MRRAVFLFLVVSAHPFYGQIGPTKESKPTINLSIAPTARAEKNKWIRAAQIPAVFTVVGLYSMTNNKILNRKSIQEERNEEFPRFRTHVDDYLQYVPSAAVYGLNALGIKGKNSFGNRTALLIKSEAMMAVITYSLKKITRVPRPDTGEPTSFPSGHTAQAFAAATFMAKEYGHRSIWYPVGAYTIATGIGVLRVMNNRHWVSDVLAGAGIGILSTNIVYLTHRYKWGGKNKSTTIVPTYSSGPGLYFCYTFN